MWLTWLATVFSLMNSSSPMTRLVLPRASSSSTSSSRWVSPSGGSRRCRRSVRRPRPRQRVERRARAAPRLHRRPCPRRPALGTPRRSAAGCGPPRRGRRGRGRSSKARRSSTQRSRRVAAAQEHRARARGGRGPEHRRPRARWRWPAAPRRPIAGRVEVAGGEHDLDERGEQPERAIGSSASPRARRIIASASSTRPCARRSSASPGCGSWPSSLARGVGGLGAVELAERAEQVGLEAGRRAERATGPAGEAVARVPSARERLGPPPEHAEHLGASGRSSGRGRARAPAGCRTTASSMPSTTGSAATSDSSAHASITVQYASPVASGRQLAGLDRHHRLVEQRHALGDLAEVDQHAPLADAGERDQLAVGEPRRRSCRPARSARARPGCRRPRTARIIAEPVLEVALLDAVDLGLVEQARGAVHPAAAPGQVALEPEALRQPHRRSGPPGGSCRRRGIAGGPAPRARSPPRRGR